MKLSTASLFAPLVLALSACSPEMMLDPDGGDASRPRPDAIEPFFDATARDVAAPMDAAAPVTCTDWCAARLSECGDPPELAREQCAERCARTPMPNDVIACLQRTACIDVRTAFSRAAGICGLEPVLDSGVSRPDVIADTGVRVDTGVIVDTGVRVDSGVMDTGVRVDSGVMDTGVRVDSGVTDTGVRVDTGVTDTGVRIDSGVTDTGVRTDSATDAPRG